MALRSRRIAIDGGYRNVLEWGEPGSAPVLLQHGMRDHAHSWKWVAEHLSQRFHVIAPDLRGHGDSDWSRDGHYTLAAYVADLAQVIDVCGLADCGLVGHSLGGQIVLRYAASFPEKVKALVVIEGVELPIVRDERQDPVPYPARLREWIDGQPMRRMRQPRYYPDESFAARRMAEANPGVDRETIGYLAATGVVAEAGLGLRWKYDPACRFRAPEDQQGTDLDDILSAVACPALLTYGECSWIDPPPPERAGRVRRSKIVRFADASHWLHHQRRAEFCQMADSFLTQPDTFLDSEINRYA